MIKFINRFTGNEMWVAEDRVEEYKAAGHKLAADKPKPITPTVKPKTPAKRRSKSEVI